MESRIKLLGHPVHPMLIVPPLGLFGTSLAFDAVHLVTRQGLWSEMAYWLIAAGVAGGAAAAPFGLVDWLLRRGSPADPGALPIALSVLGVGMAALSGWLGGELVDRLGVGVDNGAHLNALPSLAPGRAPARPPRREDRARA